MTELHWWSASEMAEAIRKRDLSASEVLEHHIARVEALDGPINAVVRWDTDRARAAARAADEAVVRGDDLGPLHGVPMTIKDSFQTEGCITTSGSPDLADYVPDADAWPVARLREAGAIPFAKTNLPIFAGDIQSFNEVYGTTNNPHDLERTPGGSSGGSSAALAMGFTPLELGSDIGGSIRVPAHYVGVMGHKPSYGIVPAHGQIPGMPGTMSQAMGIHVSMTGADLTGNSLWISKGPEHNFQIETDRRVGVDYAGQDSLLPWRYYMKGNRWVSKLKQPVINSKYVTTH